MRTFLHTNPYTKCSAILIFVVFLCTLVQNESWKNPNEVIASDVKGYYGFLPALFIHNDLEFNNSEDYRIGGDSKLWYVLTEDNKKFIKYPPGMAILNSPFFLAAHASTSFADAEPNGYSYPYQIGLLIGSLFYGVLGLIYLCKLLLRHYDDRATASTILVVYLATNLFYYSTYEFALTHCYSFALLTAFLYGTVRWLETSSWKFVFLLGISGGLMVAVRNIDLVFLSFILLYGVRSFGDLKGRFQLLLQKRGQVLVGIGCILLMLTPQILYNHYVSGSLFMYTYTNEHFFFGAPHLFDSILSYRNGLLVYSPVLILAVIGFLFLRKRGGPFLATVAFSVPVYYYILASWWCWWFIGFGNRAYINLYPILALAIAAFFSYLYETKRWKLFLVNCFVIGALLLNWHQSAQLKLGILSWDSMNKDLYWRVLGCDARSPSHGLFVQTPDYEDALKGINTTYIFETDTISHKFYSFEKAQHEFHINQTRSTHHWGNASVFIPAKIEWLGSFFISVPKGTTHISIKAWLKGKGEAILAIKDSISFNYCAAERVKTDGDWRQIEVFTALPVGQTFPTLEFYVWNKGLKRTYIDDVTIDYLRVTSKKISK